MSEYRPPRSMQSYGLWMALTEPDNWDLTRMRNEAPEMEYKPTVSILLPVHNPEPSWLEGALDSVMAQTYPYWELCVCDDASTEEHVGRTLDLYERLDGRIKVKRLERNENICAATNHALSLATGEFAGLLDHDDELAPHALFEVVKFLQERPEADLVYSDEDKVGADDRRRDPHFKVGFSPDLAMSCNYLCHFSVYRRSLLEELGGWREGFDGAQDLELVQRVAERTDRIFHIPQILYHWRMVEGSTAMGAAGKPYTHERARRGIEDSLQRQGIAGSVKDSGLMPNTFKVEREIAGEPKVSVIVPCEGEVPPRLVESLRDKTSYPNYEILTLDTTQGVLVSESGEREQLKGYTRPAGMYNAAVREADGEYVTFISPELEAASYGWLEELLQHAQREGVGAVGGKLTLPNGRVFQAGLVLDSRVGGSAPGGRRLYRYCDQRAMGYPLVFALTSNRSAVSASCMMLRKEVFERSGGFDEGRFRFEFADVDLCLRLRERGYLFVCNPYASFTHHGPATEPDELSPAEERYARERWGHVLDNDPYYNPNLAWDPEALQPARTKPWLPRPEKPETEGEKERGDTAKQGGQTAPGVRPEAPRVSRVFREAVDLPPPFFIVGHGRSGTTWLELTLNSHPEISCKGSGMFFGRDMQLYDGQSTLPASLASCQDLRTWHDMRANYWSNLSFEEDLPGFVRAIADNTMAMELAESGKRLAGDRTPHYVSYLEEVYELYPDAKVIHVIRDGRDVAVSNIHAVWQNARDRGGPVELEPELQQKRDSYLTDREGFIEKGESVFTGARVEQLAESWRDAVGKGRADGRRLFGELYTEVRYEDLLEDAHGEFSRLLGFLGAERDPQTIRRMVEENSFEKVTGRKRGQEDPNAFERRGVAGDWEEVFTGRDRRIFEEKAGELLEELGYESNDAPKKNEETTAEEAHPASKPHPSARVPAARLSRENPPFFVVGHGRSGTTWSERLLNSHPEVLCKGSGMFFGRAKSLFDTQRTLPVALTNCPGLRTWHSMQPNYWSGRPFEEDVAGMVQALANHIMYGELEKSGKKLVGDRTPHHVTCLEEIKELYPEAKIIHVLRDGRDVAISNLHAFWNSARDRGGPVDLAPEEIERRDAYLKDRDTFLESDKSIFSEARIVNFSRGWNNVVTKGRREGAQLFGENYHEIRYEALLEEPHPELARLFGFLEVSQDPEMIQHVVEENSFEKRVSGRARGEEDVTSFFRKGIQGDWKEVFTERDRRVFKEQTGDLLMTLGYEKDMSW